MSLCKLLMLNFVVRMQERFSSYDSSMISHIRFTVHHHSRVCSIFLKVEVWRFRFAFLAILSAVLSESFLAQLEFYHSC